MKIRDRMLELGVITRAIADHSNTFCPPLVITDGEIDRIIDALGDRRRGVTSCTSSTRSTSAAG